MENHNGINSDGVFGSEFDPKFQTPEENLFIYGRHIVRIYDSSHETQDYYDQAVNLKLSTVLRLEKATTEELHQIEEVIQDLKYCTFDHCLNLAIKAGKALIAMDTTYSEITDNDFFKEVMFDHPLLGRLDSWDGRKIDVAELLNTIQQRKVKPHHTEDQIGERLITEVLRQYALMNLSIFQGLEF